MVARSPFERAAAEFPHPSKNRCFLVFLCFPVHYYHIKTRRQCGEGQDQMGGLSMRRLVAGTGIDGARAGVGEPDFAILGRLGRLA